MAEIEKFASDNVCKILVGNKIDLVDKRVVSREEGEELAKHYNIPYLETSAKNNICVEESFVTMATQIKKTLINRGQFSQNSLSGKTGGYGKGTRLEYTPQGVEEDPSNVKLRQQNARKQASGGCC